MLETERLLLRPVNKDDIDDLFRIYGDPLTNTFNPAGPFPDIDYARNVFIKWTNHWRNYRFGNLAIAEKDTPGHTIGFGGLSIRSFESITVNNLGYRFEVEAWGKGYATEIARFLVGYGFRELNLQDISATVRAHHIVSQNVLIKSGLRFVREIQDVPDASASLLFNLTKEYWIKNRYNGI